MLSLIHSIYGRVNWRTLVAYIVAILLELPFVNTTLYTGPLVSHLGGADIAWIVGLVVSTVVYYALMRTRARAATRPLKRRSRKAGRQADAR